MPHFIEIDGVWTQSTDPHDELLTHCKTVVPNTITLSGGVALPSTIVELMIIPDDGFAINATDFENKTLATYSNHPELFNHNPSDWLMVSQNTDGFTQGVRFTNTNPAADEPSNAWVEGNKVKAEIKLNSSYVPTSDMTLQLDFYNKSWNNLNIETRRVTIAFLEPCTNSPGDNQRPRPSNFTVVPAEGVVYYGASLHDNITNDFGNQRYKSPQQAGPGNAISLSLDGENTSYGYLSGFNHMAYIHYFTTDVEVNIAEQTAVPKILANITCSFDLEYPLEWNSKNQIRPFLQSSVEPNPGTQLVFGFAKVGGTDDFDTNPTKCVKVLGHDNVIKRDTYINDNYPNKFSQQNVTFTNTVSGNRYGGSYSGEYTTVVTGISYDLVFTENFNGLKPDNPLSMYEHFDSDSSDLFNSEHPLDEHGEPALITDPAHPFEGFMLGFDDSVTGPRNGGYWNNTLQGYFWNLNYTCYQGWYTRLYSLDVDTGVAPSRFTSYNTINKTESYAIRNIITNFNKLSGSKSNNLIPSEGIGEGKGEITILGDYGAEFEVMLKEVESGINDSDTAQTGLSKSGGYATADITSSILNGGVVSGMPIGRIKLPKSGAYTINLPEIKRLESRDAFKVFELHLAASLNTSILKSALNDGGVLHRPAVQESNKTSNVGVTLVNKYYQYPPVGVKFNAYTHAGASPIANYTVTDAKPFGGTSGVLANNRYGAKPLSKSGETKSFQFRQRKGGATFSLNTSVLTPKYAADGTTVAYYSIPSKFFTKSIKNNGEEYTIQARAHIGNGLQDNAVTDCTIDIQVRLIKYGKQTQMLSIDFKEIFIES
tara:strand:+ start:11755 stop:14226 length:2472 start_codon:yes stop_codon:yes gene_type:complete